MAFRESKQPKLIALALLFCSIAFGNSINLGTVSIPGIVGNEFSSKTVTVYLSGPTGIVLETSYPYGGLNGPTCQRPHICYGDTYIEISSSQYGYFFFGLTYYPTTVDGSVQGSERFFVSGSSVNFTFTVGNIFYNLDPLDHSYPTNSFSPTIGTFPDYGSPGSQVYQQGTISLTPEVSTWALTLSALIGIGLYSSKKPWSKLRI